MDKRALAITVAAAVAVGGSAFAVSRLRTSHVPTLDVPTVGVTETEAEPSGTTSVSETVKDIIETVTEAATTKAAKTEWQMSSYSPEADSPREQETTAKTTAATETESVTDKNNKGTTKGNADKSTEASTSPQSTARTSSGDLPKDMSIKGLYKLGYDSIGTKKYIYNNDKNAAQSKFGYNRFYDSAAGLLDFHIDTCRLPFKNYKGKDWMIQLWKGTYITGEIGTVGCEIGLYNRAAGKWGGSFDHYACAKEPDWLNMEMTLLWDDEYNGNYKSQFTRNYGIYWWPTGFVDGQLRDIKDTSCLRVLGRITFTDEDMAKLFEAALANVGFKKVGTFDPTKPDTYRRYVCDVIFCWQDARD